jgi:hypothetical protein
MLFFGSISGGGSNLWQLNGAAPNSISTTAPTVTGIDTPNFFNNLLRIVSGQVFNALDFVGTLWNDTTGDETIINGIVNTPTTTLGLILYRNQVTQAQTGFIVDYATKEAIIHTSDGGNLEVLRVQTVTGIGEEITDNTGAGVSVAMAKSSSAEVTEIKQAGATVFNYGSDATGFIITDGTNQRFKVKANGNILTDQTTAGSVHILPTAEMPIYDTSGALQGYIKIYN